MEPQTSGQTPFNDLPEEQQRYILNRTAEGANERQAELMVSGQTFEEWLAVLPLANDNRGYGLDGSLSRRGGIHLIDAECRTRADEAVRAERASLVEFARKYEMKHGDDSFDATELDIEAEYRNLFQLPKGTEGKQ